ncbi:hypothetical protein EV122DRAFT_285718 [Schizophyllum commune]
MLSFSHGAPQLSYDLSPPELAEPRIMVATSVCRTDVEYDLTFTFRPTWAEQPRFRSLTEGTLDMWTPPAATSRLTPDACAAGAH